MACKTMMSRWLLAGFILMAAVLPWYSVSAEQASRTYVVGVENEDYFPHYRYRDGRYSGYGRDLLDVFAEWAGVKFQYRALPVNQLFNDLVSGEVDLKYPANPAWHTKQKDDVKVSYSQPAVTYVEGLMVRPHLRGKGLAAVKRISIVRGFTPTGYESQRRAGTITFLEFDSTADVLKAAINGHTDAAYVERSVGDYVLRKVLNQPAALVFDSSATSTRSNFLLATINQPALIRQVDRFLTEQSTQVQKLREKYGLAY